MRRLTSGLVAALFVFAGCGSGGGEQEQERYSRAERFDRDGIHVLKLVGTPYEMGVQHGRLMAPELIEGVTFVEEDPLFSLLMPLARSQDLVADALEYSYPEVYEECRGMAKGASRAGVEGWDLDTCITLAYGDVVLAFVSDLLDTGCTQFVAGGSATVDGALIHGRNMDWDRLSYLINHPTVIVRQPEDGQASLSLGFPGCVAPYNGLNEAGLAMATNNDGANPDLDPNQRGRPGHTQMVYKMLSEATSLEEAESFLEGEAHARATVITVSDGDNRDAAVFEISPSHMGVRRMSTEGVVYATNHFIDPDMDPYDNEPNSPTDSTVCRLKRLDQLLPADGEDSLHGQIDPPTAAGIMGDRHNACTGEDYGPEPFDNNGSIGTNGCIWSMVFVPGKRQVFFAGGEPPVPLQPYVGFDLMDLLLPDGDGATEPAELIVQ